MPKLCVTYLCTTADASVRDSFSFSSFEGLIEGATTTDRRRTLGGGPTSATGLTCATRAFETVLDRLLLRYIGTDVIVQALLV